MQTPMLNPNGGRMRARHFLVRFLTPAFLGDAGQAGQWRTPPFKHLLREWWRVAWAAEHDPAGWPRMRAEEGKLLGHAWLNTAQGEDTVRSRRSLVRLRLDPWAAGTMKNMPRTAPAGAGQRAVPSHVYLGYGPVKSATELKMVHPIDAETSARLSLAFPDDESGARLLDPALSLIHAFGAVGGRSRNGWGSLCLEREDGAAPPLAIERYGRPWRECLDVEWAHAIGKDQTGLLMWITPPRREWQTVIEDLARVRKEVNALASSSGKREVLNQPVKGKGERVPSNLRFKVVQGDAGQLQGLVFHMPCLPPPAQHISRQEIEDVWQAVHDHLDGALQRCVS